MNSMGDAVFAAHRRRLQDLPLPPITPEANSSNTMPLADPPAATAPAPATVASESRLHVATIADADYFEPCAVTFISLIEHCHRRADLVFHVILDRKTSVDGTNGSLGKLRSTLDAFGFREPDNLILHRVDRSEFAELMRMGAPLLPHLTDASFFRLALPELLGSQIRKVLYLDSDLIVRRDVTELFELPLGGNILAAVPERFAEGRLQDWQRPYFQAGVMLIDLAAWQEARISENTKAALQRYGKEIVLVDQDGLNISVDGRWRPLDRCWNHLHTSSGSFWSILLGRRTVIHCAGAFKPWLDGECPSLVRRRYRRWVLKTAWRNAPQPPLRLVTNLVFLCGCKPSFRNVFNSIPPCHWVAIQTRPFRQRLQTLLKKMRCCALP